MYNLIFKCLVSGLNQHKCVVLTTCQFFNSPLEFLVIEGFRTCCNAYLAYSYEMKITKTIHLNIPFPNLPLDGFPQEYTTPDSIDMLA